MPDPTTVSPSPSWPSVSNYVVCFSPSAEPAHTLSYRHVLIFYVLMASFVCVLYYHSFIATYWIGACRKNLILCALFVPSRLIFVLWPSLFPLGVVC